MNEREHILAEFEKSREALKKLILEAPEKNEQGLSLPVGRQRQRGGYAVNFLRA